MAVVKVKIFVPEITNVMTLFDKIQVQRSEAGTPYSDAVLITADSIEPPVLVGTEEGPYSSLQGTTMLIKVDGGAEQSVTFTAANPISLSNVIDEFNSTITDAEMADDGTGKPEITGLTDGTGGILELTGGSALAVLGYATGQKDNGEDPHVTLLAGIDAYEYDDKSGEASYWYRTRYYNLSSGVFSSWSDWIQGDTGAAVDAANLIVGKVKLANPDGTAHVGAKVTIVNVYQPLIVDDYFMSGRQIQIETGGTGQAETTLIKGSTVDVILEGTSVIRRILVPDTGTEFDLLDPTLQQDDPFNIQVPDLPSAVRRT